MTTEEAHAGRFYGVYLLCSESMEKRYKGKCYIGYTVNPNRRINQHNKGKEFGGAKKTSKKGPWKMVMIVHGFPNNIAALQFEWAWQQPILSNRLKMYHELKRKLPKETYFDYNFRILSRLLNVGPWCRLPLIIRWLDLEYKRDFEIDLLPPRHMQIAEGVITIEKSKSINKNDKKIWAPECHLCMQKIDNTERSRIGCLNKLCKLTCHIICLANHMIASDLRNRGHLIPINGECPLCETELTWVALLQNKHKMQGILNEEVGEESEEELDMSEEESSEAQTSDEDEPMMGENIEKDLEVYEISD